MAAHAVKNPFHCCCKNTALTGPRLLTNTCAFAPIFKNVVCYSNSKRRQSSGERENSENSRDNTRDIGGHLFGEGSCSLGFGTPEAVSVQKEKTGKKWSETSYKDR